MDLLLLCVMLQLMDYKLKWSESQTELQQQLKAAKKVYNLGIFSDSLYTGRYYSMHALVRIMYCP